MRSQRERIYLEQVMKEENIRRLDANRDHEPAIGRSADSHVRRFRKGGSCGQSGALIQFVPFPDPSSSALAKDDGER